MMMVVRMLRLIDIGLGMVGLFMWVVGVRDSSR